MSQQRVLTELHNCANAESGLSLQLLSAFPVPLFCQLAKLSLCVSSRFPQAIVGALPIAVAGQHEEQVGKSIEINHNLRIDRFGLGESDNAHLNAATNRARVMQMGSRR